jgi:hypothetical protein
VAKKGSSGSGKITQVKNGASTPKLIKKGATVPAKPKPKPSGK